VGGDRVHQLAAGRPLGGEHRGVSRGNAIASLVAGWNALPHEDDSTTWKTHSVMRGAGGRLRPLIECGLVGPLMAWLTGISARNLQDWPGPSMPRRPGQPRLPESQANHRHD
jgi:hypothetical protein